MNGVEIIRKFIGSHFLLERLAREVIERLPLSIHYRLYYGKTFLYWSTFLKASQYWDKEKLEAFQVEQMRSLLGHAAHYVPYYRKLFADHGINVQQVQSLDDMRVIPYLSKETVRDVGHDFIAENIPHRALIKTNTSGSTGIPLVIYKTRESDEKLHAYLFDLWSRVGYDSKKRVVFFTWRNITMGGKRAKSSLRCGNKLYLSTAVVSDAWMQKCYDMIREFRPEFVFGYKTILLALSSFIKEQGLLPLHGLRAVFAYAETIFPWQKRIIEESFNTRVFPHYGMFEGVIFGGGCEYSDLYHLYPQYGITEFVGMDDGRHEMVGTGFRNYAMPLIRYRTMDIAVKGSDSCGGCNRNHQLVESIDGRMNEFLVTKDGKMFYTSLSGLDSDIFQNVKQFQLYQDEPGIAYLKIVRGHTYTDSDTLLMSEQINKRFNIPESGLEIHIVFVEAIERTASGKILMTDQKLNITDFLKIRMV